jgi:hypothetical protein
MTVYTLRVRTRRSGATRRLRFWSGAFSHRSGSRDRLLAALHGEKAITDPRAAAVALRGRIDDHTARNRATRR